MTDFPCVVIATALPVEFAAVLAHLEERREERHEAGTIYESGFVQPGTQTWRVGVVQTGARNPRAAFEIERAVRHFRPTHVFFVGVAGALKDAKIGDVVAATKVYDTEGGKADTVYRPRLDFGQSSYAMQQLASSSARDSTWHEQIRRSPAYNGQLRPHPQALVGPVASGENVVGSSQSQVYEFLKQHCSDALAVEMEGFGFLIAMHANEGVSALLVRGISDCINGKSGADASGSQEVASCHAAAFTIDVLSRVQISLPNRSASNLQAASPASTNHDETSRQDDFWKELNALALRLYPRGPEENQLWVRAGGDLSSIERHSTPKATWFAALRTLRLGGGGAGASPRLLVEAMNDDFPQNPELEKLRRVI